MIKMPESLESFKPDILNFTQEIFNGRSLQQIEERHEQARLGDGRQKVGS